MGSGFASILCFGRQRESSNLYQVAHEPTTVNRNTMALAGEFSGIACSVGRKTSCSLPDECRSPQITHLNDALLAQLDLPKMESFWFTAEDGTKLEGFLIRPPGFDPAKKYPVKFLIHGGPQGAGATPGATAGTRSSLPPTATSWS
jgi:hypothetical protein